MTAFGVAWPRDEGMFVDYVASIVEGGGSRSAVSRALFALRFVETSGGVRKGHQLASSPLITAAVREFELVVVTV